MEPIERWLEGLGLPQYASTFVENGIDASVLGDLTDNDLRELGVLLGHRRKMLRAISEKAAPTRSAGQGLADTGATLTAQSKDAAPSALAERRHLTVMFCDLVGSTALAAKLDPEDLREVVRAYQSACAKVIARYEGFVAQYLGDGVMAYFGYPAAHEDDAERAVRAGLDLVPAVAELDLKAKVEVRVGIATGLVVVGDLIGEHAGKERAVTGETPNLAARLQGLAAPGTVVVSAATRRLLAGMFDLRDLGAQPVKGLNAPVQAFAVAGVRSFESRFEARAGGLTGFIGREEECEHLLDRWKLARQGRGQVLIVSGEAGIGKSRLTAWLVDKVASEPHTRMRYQCTPHHKDSALYPTITQIERAAGIAANEPGAAKLARLEAVLSLAETEAADTVPLFAALLAIPTGEKYPPLAISPGQQRQRTFAALLDRVEALARQKPLLMIYEDAHWADATSLELLDSLVDRLARLPVLFVVTGRPEFSPTWAGRHNVSTITLQKLDKRHARAMVERVTGGAALPADLLDQIITKTDGVPLFIEELTKTVLEDGSSLRSTATLPIPATLQDSLMARLDRSNSVKEIAQIGAAIGREFSYKLLLAVAGMDEATVRAGLTNLEDAELAIRRGLPPDATYTFKHALVQDAAYETLLKSRRQIIHRRIAKALRDEFSLLAETEPEIIAHHFTGAGRVGQAIGWWSTAGKTASQRGALVEAINHFERALRLADNSAASTISLAQRIELQNMYSCALSAEGPGEFKTSAAFVHLARLADRTGDLKQQMSALSGKLIGESARGEINLSLITVNTYNSIAIRADITSDIIWSKNFQAVSSLYNGNYLVSIDLFERNMTPEPSGIYDHLTVSSSMIAFAWMVCGDYERAFLYNKRALDRAYAIANLPTLLNTLYRECIFWAVCGNLDRTRSSAEALAGLAAEHRAKPWSLVVSAFEGWIAWHEGRTADATVAIEKCLMILGKRGSHTSPLFFTLWSRMLSKEDPSRAAMALGKVIASNETTGNLWYDAEMLRFCSIFQRHSAHGSISDAVKPLLRSLMIARAQGARTFELRASLDLARVYCEIGREREATLLLEGALVGFEPMPELPEVGEAQQLLAEMGGSVR